MCFWVFINFFKKGSHQADTLYHHPEDQKNIGPSGSEYGVRHIQCLMAFLAVTILLGLRFNLSMAIISMTDKNSTNVPVLPWDESMKGIVLSSYLWAYPFAQILGGPIAEHFGSKAVLVTSVFFCGAMSILTPLVVLIDEVGFYLIIVVRLLQGMSQALLYPAASFLLSRWAPISERGKLLYFVYSGDRLGIFGTMAISGLLSDSRWGWPSIFYLMGGSAILWALVFSYIGADSPQVHKTISRSERDYILSSLPNTASERKALRTPWKAIMTSLPVWSATLAQCGYQWTYHTVAVGGPLYIDGVFVMDIKRSGFLLSLPHVLSYIVGFGFAAINDVIINQNKVPKIKIRKFWNSIALWGGALGLCVLAFAGKSEVLAVGALIVTTMLHGTINLGIFSNQLDLSPNFAGTLMGVTCGISCCAGTLSILIEGFIVTDTKSLFQWQIVFLVAAAVSFVSNLIFIVVGTAEVQPWNEPVKEEKLTKS